MENESPAERAARMLREVQESDEEAQARARAEIAKKKNEAGIAETKDAEPPEGLLDFWDFDEGKV